MRRKRKLSDFKEIGGVYVLPDDPSTTFGYSDGMRTEQGIFDIIRSTGDVSDGSTELMARARTWPEYYHLGVGRSNILRCLSLNPESSVLELGAGCGGITRYLGENFARVDAIEGSERRARIARERCRGLDNVRVFCANFQDIEISSSYDIVTLIGVLEYAPVYFGEEEGRGEQACLNLLQFAKRALNPTGVLVIAIENRVGIKYWSGCPEDHTGRLFDGLCGYVNERGPITFSRPELKALLSQAGFAGISFYFCYPDYKFASTIFSDIGNEREFFLHNWVETPFSGYVNPRIYTFHEGAILKTLSSLGLLKEFANSFLVVAGRGSVPPAPWIAKRFAMNRHRHLRCVTTLLAPSASTPDVYISKERLDGEDKERFVEGGGIRVKHKIFSVPWYTGDLLIYEFFDAMRHSNYKKKIYDLLSVYHDELLRRYSIRQTDMFGYPLLKGSAFDFIPRNIIKRQSALCCIDEEWEIQQPLPVDFMMYRCISLDVIEGQYIWIRERIKNIEKSTVAWIRQFYPQYGSRRNRENRLLEEKFQKVVGCEINIRHVILRSRSGILSNQKIWRIAKWVWKRLPGSIKQK
ncbi:hypothetical protein DRN97_09415, partial [Methanosarcinales archaeon]